MMNKQLRNEEEYKNLAVRARRMTSIAAAIQENPLWVMRSTMTVIYREDARSKFMWLEYRSTEGEVVWNVYLTDIGTMSALAKEAADLSSSHFFDSEPGQLPLAMWFLFEFVKRARHKFWNVPLDGAHSLPDGWCRYWLNWWTGKYEDNYGNEIAEEEVKNVW